MVVPEENDVREQCVVRITYHEARGTGHGGANGPGPVLLTYTAVLLLVPFVQALASSLGAKLGERMDRAASDGMRRLLRQQASESGPTRIAGPWPKAPVELSPGAHPRIVLEVDEDDPAEALCEIPRMDFAALAALVPADEERQLRVVHIGERWMTYFVGGQPALHAWNPESRTWDQARDDSTG
ncbi:hypothetical protein SMCF_7146 [Streptomyces coelicoflavus ZG0656]|nr:hypothetical protein SMCF_7146 [Streptomyces coelicoflavus ZG0656]MZE42287.1 hypothetical protein [Streptomyces sp. SID5477]